MTSRGILVFNHESRDWMIWIRQQPYWVYEGSLLEVRIKNNYLSAMMTKDLDWNIALDYDVRFVLHPHEVYKVRIQKEDYVRADAPL